MIVVCVHFGEAKKATPFTYHEDFLVSRLKTIWRRAHEVPANEEVIFRDMKGKVLKDNVTIGRLQPVLPGANVVYIKAEKVKAKDELKFRDLTSTTTRVWQVQPITGRDAFGRWVVMPDKRCIISVTFSVTCAVVSGEDGSVQWILVDLKQGQRMARVREVLAQKYERPAHYFSYAYMTGLFYWSSAGERRHATHYNVIKDSNVLQVTEDDETGELLSDERPILGTVSNFHDDTKLPIPLNGTARILVFTKTEFLCSAEDDELGLRVLDCKAMPFEDRRIVAFNDGIALRDKRDNGPPRLFASLNDGSKFGDVSTGQVFESREAVYAWDGLEVPTEDRDWGQHVFYFYDGLRLPRWKIGEGHFLQVILRPHDTLELRDGALVRRASTQPYEVGGAIPDMWCDRYKEAVDDTDIYVRVTNYLRSVQ